MSYAIIIIIYLRKKENSKSACKKRYRSAWSIDTYILYKPLARYVDDIFIREQERKELVSARKTSYFSSPPLAP